MDDITIPPYFTIINITINNSKSQEFKNPIITGYIKESSALQLTLAIVLANHPLAFYRSRSFPFLSKMKERLRSFLN